MPTRSPRVISRRRRRLAWALALSADAIQILFAPLLFAGAASPFDDALDIAVSLAMFALLGWHPAFVPAIAFKLVPFVDLAPTWTIAVFAATRGLRDAPASGATVVDEPPPALTDASEPPKR